MTAKLTEPDLRSECCDAVVNYRYCSKCGQECRIRSVATTVWWWLLDTPLIPFAVFFALAFIAYRLWR